MKIKLLITLFISMQLSAQEISPIKQGEPSPISGYVIDREMEKTMRTANETQLSQKKVIIKLEELSLLNNSKVDVYRDEVKNLEKENSSLKINSTLGNILYFTMGAVLTGLASYAVIRTVK